MRKTILTIIFLTYCSPAFADRVTELEDQVTILKKQVATMQWQMESLMAEKNQHTLTEQSKPAKNEIEYPTLSVKREEPRINFKLKPGWAALTYQTRGDNPRKINTAGFAISSEADVRLIKKTSFNLAVDAFLPSEWANMSTDFGFVDRLRETHARFYTLSPNVRYKILDTDKSTLGLSLGYEIFFQRFSPEGDARGGHGPRLGIIADFSPTKRLSFTTEGFYTSFFDVEKERRQRTEGHAFRFDIGSRYRFYNGFELGTGYRGYLLSIDRNTKPGRNGDEEFTRMDHLYGFFGISF